MQTEEDSQEALLAILYTGGYLSIKKELSLVGMAESYYSLRFSNLEVQTDYMQRLSFILRNSKKQSSYMKFQGLRNALEGRQWEEFICHLESILAETPYMLYKIKKNEAMFQYQLYVILITAGYMPFMKVPVSSGRTDLAVTSTNMTYIVECKLENNEENPLDQCRAKYLKRYLYCGKDVVCIGLKCSPKVGIPSWGVARYTPTGELVEEAGAIKVSKKSISSTFQTRAETKTTTSTTVPILTAASDLLPGQLIKEE